MEHGKLDTSTTSFIDGFRVALLPQKGELLIEIRATRLSPLDPSTTQEQAHLFVVPRDVAQAMSSALSAALSSQSQRPS